MRFLMKIAIPTPAENPVAGDPALGEMLQRLYRDIGAKANYSNMQDGRRIDYALIDVEPDEITATAEKVFRLLEVKSEFLPENVPTPFYGRSGY